MAKFMTVVFEFEEGAELAKKITSAFQSDSMMYEDAKITAVSMENEISRAERLEFDLEALCDR